MKPVRHNICNNLQRSILNELAKNVITLYILNEIKDAVRFRTHILLDMTYRLDELWISGPEEYMLYDGISR